ncbi:hypothetical protein ACFLXC_04115 [Chloroflexota bacterium]
MIVKIPLTGEATKYDPKAGQIDGLGISGNPDNPVQPIDIDLGGVSWKLISIDFDNDRAEIDIKAPDTVNVLKPGGDPENPADYERKTLSSAEKEAMLISADSSLKSKTVDELYAIAKQPRLIKKQSDVELWIAQPPKEGIRKGG